MQKPIVTAAAALASLVLLTACGTETGSGGGAGAVGSDAFVANVRWTFDTLTVDGKKTTAPPGAYVEFGEDGRASGNSGCNHFGGESEVRGDTLTVTLGETTEMGCDASLQSFETLLHKTFDGRFKAVVDGDTLTLTRSDGDTLVLSSQPPAPLKGTKWTVESLVSGDTASSLPAGTEGRAHFVIAEDGKVTGNLGCNRFSTTATVSGSTITFGRLASTRMVCAPPQMKVEEAMSKVFESRATYGLHVRSLTLTAPDGTGVAAATKPVTKD
ncbi:MULTISPECIES: META domain-containing protein [Streptomyces]|uniref:META domain-containing protein n=1 Tax=Streptomyces solicathayae TaxID=3081768 RepID=A0ABZ0LVH2_9ACTN|nr:META domain-containing protein [Streptomyces sp. HUAS YS2]WOX23449.1 META domain-containing protein [Streptomyces sp. HUAS YS2]